ncbi:MAG: (2Fe-2S)-binding protein [Dehalococcoidales bacterium]|jgi:carbon-monoxide dehydrogenase small subunit|nr:(2Fe-2S)-binding protein [Dehalococcoidales bacterium]MDX9986192.1 (2Fe-2S)-binding protein [Dehalococcoidales bacterium]
MPEKEKETQDGQISRRQFIRNAGIVVGGTAVGSAFLLTACGGDGETVTNTVTKTVNVTTTAGSGTTQTVTTTAAGTTTYVCPYDNQQFANLAELKAHLEAQHMEALTKTRLVTLNVNSNDYIVEVEPQWTLAFVIRDKLGLTGTKIGCDEGACGTCTVLLESIPILSCMVLAIECESKNILTIEGLEAKDGTLHPIQKAFSEEMGFQCGFCTPGIIVTTKALLDKNPSPTTDDIKSALSGNLCSCGAYDSILKSVLSAANKGGI